MASIVIVHGAFGGGWEWSGVAALLRESANVVFTPTLTGLGERAHLAGPSVSLATHVADVAALIEMEDLHDVVLVGVSYGGLPATGAADKLAPRIRRLVYVDALVPRDGEAALDLLPRSAGDLIRESAASDPEGWRVGVPRVVLPPESVGASAREPYVARLVAQPLATFTEPIRLAGAVDKVPRAFVKCTRADLGAALGTDPVERSAQRARDEGWLYREMAAPHDPHLADPHATARVLDELANVRD